ncbi:hypothetical protein ACEPPN_015213 [Leptodophora sp. 'Broadleaf-Isolate-01']
MCLKLEEFGQTLDQLKGGSVPGALRSTPPATSSSLSTPSGAAATPPEREAVEDLSSSTEYEGESSLSSQAAFAQRFLQDAINSKPISGITREMATALDALSRAVKSQNNEKDTKVLYPFARTLPPGRSVRDLSMPPIQAVFGCLRQVKEATQPQFFGIMELGSPNHFTEYLLKVYSPGDATHADLIIVNYRLLLLFAECSMVTADEATKVDYTAQLLICRDNLETLLSGLPFHLPLNMDSAYALSLAASYCVSICKPSSAWNFITASSQMVQTLGFHDRFSLPDDDAETKTYKIQLFWSIYVVEKGLSLQLGRSSTIRDIDITVPLPVQHSKLDFMFDSTSFRPIELSRLQGMVYDKIYSPGALMQPDIVRISRIKALVKDLESLAMFRQENPDTETRRANSGDSFREILNRAYRISQLSLLALLYRAMPTKEGSGTVFCHECIASAREAMREHQECRLLTSAGANGFLEPYMNWIMFNSPFVPYIILFCHVVETCNDGDLECLGAFIRSWQPRPPAFLVAYDKQLRLFSILYDVACNYVKMKSSTSQNSWNANLSNRDTAEPFMSMFQPSVIATSETNNHIGALQTTFPYTPEPFLSNDSTNNQRSIDHGYAFNAFATTGDIAMEMDPQRAQLEDWVQLNQQILRTLEDNHF